MNAFGAPTARTIALATAYQATTPAKPALVTLNLSASSALTISGGTPATADIVIGPTNAVASGTGTALGKWANSLTGTLVVGVAINAGQGTPILIPLPAGWYFAVRQTGTPTVTVTSAFDQSVG